MPDVGLSAVDEEGCLEETGTMSRLDGVEVKTNIDDDDVERALEVMDLNDETPMQIWFYEDTTVGFAPLPLLEAGICIRLRVKTPSKGDCTVKLRPCRASQLTSRWRTLEEDGALEMRVEQDWSGARHVLAASLEAALSDAVIAAAADAVADATPSELLDVDQRDYLAECTGVPVDVAGLTRLGPIAATRWDVGGVLGDLGVRAERWQVAGTTMLELSAKTDDEAAASGAQQDLLEEVARLGLHVATEEVTKTRRVLTALALGQRR
jgi:hypothetical protein